MRFASIAGLALCLTLLVDGTADARSRRPPRETPPQADEWSFMGDQDARPPAQRPASPGASFPGQSYVVTREMMDQYQARSICDALRSRRASRSPAAGEGKSRAGSAAAPPAARRVGEISLISSNVRRPPGRTGRCARAERPVPDQWPSDFVTNCMTEVPLQIGGAPAGRSMSTRQSMVKSSAFARMKSMIASRSDVFGAVFTDQGSMPRRRIDAVRRRDVLIQKCLGLD